MPQSANITLAPAISVVVVSYNTPETLRLCLESLAAQPAAEILVADCSATDPAKTLAERFPNVKFLHFDTSLSIPQLRWKGLKNTTGEIVANLESWMVPATGWIDALSAAHQRRPAASVVGGPVAFRPEGGGSPFAWADFLYEYGRHMAPIDNGAAPELTGANCSYKRAALDDCQDLIDNGAWDTAIHERLQSRGQTLWREARAVVYYRGDPATAQALSQRFHYGRWFAAERKGRMTPPERLLRTLSFPLVPLVLLRRLWISLRGKPHGKWHVIRSWPWLLLFYTLWACGEACGYLLGGGSSKHRIF